MTEPRRRRPLSRRKMLVAGGFAALAIVSGGVLLQRRDRFEGKEMTPPQALEAIEAGEITMIDIRRPDEWAATGIAPGAEPLDMRRDDFIAALTRIADGQLDAPIALICARGVRSDRMSARLAEAGFTNIIDIPEGMLGSASGPGWLGRDLPVIRP